MSTKIAQWAYLLYSCSLIFKALSLDLIISPMFCMHSIQQSAEMMVQMKYVFDICSFMYLTFYSPRLSNQGGPAWTPTLENIWVGRLICHIAFIVRLCLLSWKAILVFTQRGTSLSRSQKLFQWVEKLFWEGKGRTSLSEIDIYYEGFFYFLGTSTMILHDYEAQPWCHFMCLLIKVLLLHICALTLPSGQVMLIIHWHTCFVSASF